MLFFAVMQLLSIVALFCSFCCLVMGIVSLSLGPRSALNRTFTLATVFAAIWTFGYAFVYSATDRSLLWFFFDLSSAANAMLCPTLVLFINLLFEKPWRKALTIALPFYVFSSVISVSFFEGHVYVKDFVLGPLGNVAIPDTGRWTFWVISSLYLVYGGLVVSLYRFSSKTTSKRLKAMTKILGNLFLLNIVLHFSINWLVIGLLKDYPAMGLLESSLTLTGSALFAMQKYRLLDLRSSNIEATIAESLFVPLFFLDPKLQVFKLNSLALQKIGRADLETNLLFPDLFEDPTSIRTAWCQMPQRNLPCKLGDVDYLLDLLPIQDRFGDLIGATAVLNGGNPLQRLVDQYTLSDREKDVLRLLIGGDSNKEIAHSLCIDLETVKSHAKNIYKKMNIKSRIDLLKLKQCSRKDLRYSQYS